MRLARRPRWRRHRACPRQARRNAFRRFPLKAGRAPLQVIRRTLADLVAQRRAQDPNLHYLDGLTLYGQADAEALPLPDGLHPDTATHRLIGERFAARAFVEGVFGR